jgi:hypothetical protein
MQDLELVNQLKERLPEALFEKLNDSLSIDTVVSKYADHLPIYRQSAILERETGIELSRGTLDGWVMSKPLLEQIKASIQAARIGALPKSALAKACDYTLTLWSRLSRFLEYPELELSNNLAENAMRPVALGRRNWIHVGSKEAGPRVAAIISIVETCRRLGLPLRDYLVSVLPALADFPINRVAELTPSAWAARI